MNNPPKHLRERKIWLCWRYEERTDSDGDPYQTKTPIDPVTGTRGDATDPGTWTSYENALDYTGTSTEIDGIGFAFPQDDLVCGIDLDDVVNSDTGDIVYNWANELVAKLDSYTEYSPSGTGLHIVIFGIKPGERCRTKLDHGNTEIEIYDENRFFTYTGDCLSETPNSVNQRNDELTSIYNEYLGDDDSVDDDEDETSVTLDDAEDDEDAGDYESLGWSLAEWRTADPTLDDLLTTENPGKHYPSASEADYATVARLLHLEYDDTDIAAILRQYRSRDKMDRDDYVTTTIKNAKKQVVGSASKPQIEANQGDADTLALWKMRHFAVATDTLPPEGFMHHEVDGSGDSDETYLGFGAETYNRTIEALDADGIEHGRDAVDAGGQMPVSAQFESDAGSDTTIDKDDAWDWSLILQAYADSDTSTREARDMAMLGFRRTHSFATFRDTGALYSYNDETGIYEPNGETIVREVTASTLESFYTQNEANEILHRIVSESYRDRQAFGADERDPKVCLKNGVLSLPDGEFSEHSPEHLFLRYAPVNWDPDADCPNFDAFLDEILESDEDKRLIYEMLGYCLYPGHPFAKSLFMYGDGSNGKSTLLEVFERILGVENVSSRGLVELEENRFAVADLYHSYANICGDLPDKAVEHTGTFKKLTGGDLVTGEEKFNDPFSFRNTAKLIFSANDPPNISDESNAMYRRLLLMNFPTEFTDPGKPGPDKREQSELLAEIASPEELSGILNRAVEALADVFDRGGFSQSESTEQVREQYKRASNPVYAFCNTCIQNDQDEYIEKQKLYTIYNRWARATGAPTKDHSVFARELYKHTDAKKGKVGGRGNQTPVYQYISLTGRGKEFVAADNSGGDQGELT